MSRVMTVAASILGAVALALLAAPASATLVMVNPDRTDMVAFEPSVDPLESFTVAGATLTFSDGTSAPGLDVLDSPDWWNPVPVGPTSGSVYTTNYPASGLITIDFAGAEVFAFALNIGANFSAHANIVATFSDGSTATSNPEWFPIGPGVSPSYGVFGDASSCASITRIQVDPASLIWGIGNMAISTGSCGAVSVPEPGTLGLLGAGLLGLGLMHRRGSRDKATV